MTDPTEPAVVLRFRTAAGEKRRVSFQAASKGALYDYLRFEEQYEDGAWRTVGSERVADLTVDGDRVRPHPEVAPAEVLES